MDEGSPSLPVQCEAVVTSAVDVVGGVSSFGLNGTIAHAVVSLRSDDRYSVMAAQAVVESCGEVIQSSLIAGLDVPFHRRRFLWSKPSHPLLQQRLASSTDDLAMEAGEPLFALPSLRLTGRLTSAAALGALSSLPVDAPVLIETQRLSMDSSSELADHLSRRQAPIVLLCSGTLGGAGALLLLDTATVAIGDTSCVVTSQRVARRSLRDAAE